MQTETAPINPIENSETFELWLSQRHPWLQTAAARLLKSHQLPTQPEMVALADLCVAQIQKTEALFETVPRGYFSPVTATDTLRIEKINKVQGVNALKADASLVFNHAGMTVVYGQNGSGKSGFARMLKHICGSRAKEDDLLPDVFSETSPDPSADIAISGVANALSWSAKNGSVSELRHVHVFDTDTAKSYFQPKNEATYEPRKMKFLSELITISDQVSQELSSRKEALYKALPDMPDNLAGSPANMFLQRLSCSTSVEAIEAACSFSEVDEAERISLESSLTQTDPQKRLAEIALEKKRLDVIKKELDVLQAAFCQTHASVVMEARRDAHAKRHAASQDAEKVFSSSSFDGIGQETWKMLWQHAKAYSEELAYPKKEFPALDDGAKCVLCHSDLDAAAKERLGNFEKFIKSSLETDAQKAEDGLSEMVKALPTLPSKEDWLLKMESLKVDTKEAETIYEELLHALSVIKASVNIQEFKEISWGALALVPVGEEKEPVFIQGALLTIYSSLAQEEKNLKDLQDDSKRAKLVERLLELKGREWLHQHKAEVEKECERLQKIQYLEAAGKLCNTKALSMKRAEVAEQELADGYKERFKAELKALGGKRIPISTVSEPGGKGKINFKLSLEGIKRPYPVLKVLSEGETRAVALSAFLADMTGSERKMPFVFDDPISSLDQEFEERVAARLVALAQDRQVIVFTHRLSLVALLEDAAAKMKGAPQQSSVDISVVTLTRFNKSAGVTSEIDVRQTKPKSGFNMIKNNQLPKLKKLESEGSVAEFEEKMRAVCSSYRILLEKTLETELLSGVVTRFKRSVQSMQIPRLAKIKPEDCALLDDLMTRYSCFEHSQSEEIAVELPTAEALENDLDRILEWIEEFSKRGN